MTIIEVLDMIEFKPFKCQMPVEVVNGHFFIEYFHGFYHFFKVGYF